MFRGVTSEGHNVPGVKSLWGRGMTAGGAKKYQQCTFFNTEHLLPKDLRFENGGTPNLLLASSAAPGGVAELLCYAIIS